MNLYSLLFLSMIQALKLKTALGKWILITFFWIGYLTYSMII